MERIAIFTDSCAGIIEKGVEVIPLYYRFNNENIEYGETHNLTPQEFFDKMKNGAIAKTSAINTSLALKKMEEKIFDGYDIIYISVSSMLSASYSNAYNAALQLIEKHEVPRITVIDSLTASLAEGLLVKKALNLVKDGYSYDDIVNYINRTKNFYCGEFLVDDLQYLQRGGRISPTKAFVGRMIGARPLLYASEEGTIEVAGIERGKQKAMKALAERINLRVGSGTIHIVHADALETANKLSRLIQVENPIKISDIDPVIGAHVGPGAYGVCYKMKEKIIKK